MLKSVSSALNAIGALNYAGTWNAATNNPTIVSSTGTQGDYYVVSVAGSTTINGISLWGVGDWIVFNGSIWEKVEGGDTINATTVTASGTITGASFIPTGASVPTNGMFLSAANSLGFATGSTENWVINASGNFNPVGAKGIGTALAPVAGLVTTTLTASGVATLASGAILATPASMTATNVTGLPLTSGVTGTLPVANGGTGTTTPGLVAGTNITSITGSWPNQTINASGGVGTVTSITAGTGLTGGVITTSGTVALDNSGVVAGSYTSTNVTVDAFGRVTAAASGTGGATLSNDTSTASNLFPLFASATSGTASTIFTSNAKLLYKPSTGELKVDVPIAGNGITVNSTTVAASYTIASGTNGFSVGPITVNSGVTVTIAAGQRWYVI